VSTPEEQTEREALVPGTPDAEVHAQYANTVNPAATTHADLPAVVEELDRIIGELGADLSVAVVSDDQAQRVSGIGLRLAIEALQDARNVVASFATSAPSAVSTTEGVVSG
jgi:ABC-type sulfate transport system permease subunit